MSRVSSRVSSTDLSKSEELKKHLKRPKTIEVIADFIQVNDLKMWSIVSLVEQIEKIESWGYRVGCNLVISDKKLRSKFRQLLLFWFNNVFLYAFALKALFSQIVFNEQSIDWLLIFGDLTPFYGRAVNRLYFNWFLICWGFHAAFVYTLVSKDNNEVREWVQRFDDDWKSTYFRSPNRDRKIVDNLVQSVTTYAKLEKSSIALYFVLMSGLHVYGSRSFSSLDTSSLIYMGWAFVNIIWCLIATTINLTALFQYFIITRAITIRFSETYMDLDFSIRSKPPAESKIISMLLSKHYMICDMVMVSNQYFKKYLFFFFVVMTYYECYLILHMFSPNRSLEVKGVLIVYIILNGLQIYFASIWSARVASMAHKPYHVVHGIGRLNTSEEVKVQAQLFVQRLNGRAIGMSILDGFVLSGGVFSSALTLIISYLSIII